MTTPSQYYHRLGKEQEKAKESLARGRAGLSNVRDLDMSGKPRLPRNATAEQLARYQHEMSRFDPYAFDPSQSQPRTPGNAQHPYGPAYPEGRAEALGRTVSLEPSDGEAAFMARRFAEGHTPPNPLRSGEVGANPGRDLSPAERGGVFDPSTGNWNSGSAIGGIPGGDVQREMQRQGNAPQAFSGQRFDLDAGETPRRAPEGFHRSVAGDGKGGARVTDRKFDAAEATGVITYQNPQGKFVNIGPDGKRSMFDTEEAATRQQPVPPAPPPSIATAADPEPRERPTSAPASAMDFEVPAGPVTPSQQARNDRQKTAEFSDRLRTEGTAPGQNVDRPAEPASPERRKPYGTPANQFVGNMFARTFEAFGNPAWNPAGDPTERPTFAGIGTGGDARTRQEQNRRYIEQESASAMRFAPGTEQRRRRVHDFYTKSRDAGILDDIPDETWKAFDVPKPPPPVGSREVNLNIDPRKLSQLFDAFKSGGAPPPEIRTLATPPSFADTSSDPKRRRREMPNRKTPMPRGAGAVAY